MIVDVGDVIKLKLSYLFKTKELGVLALLGSNT
jgi:hypothetical protein